MAALKTIERAGKRFLVKVLTSVVRTRPMTSHEILLKPPKRVLVIRQHNQMGDMLLAVPAFRAIKESFPGVHVSVLSARINRDVLVNNPYVDRVLTYNVRNPLGWILLLRSMRQSRLDMVIVLHTVSFSFTSAMLGLLSGARLRVGSTSQPFGNRLSKSFFHMELPLPGEGELQTMNETEHNLYPLRALRIHTDDLTPLLVPSAANQSWAKDFLVEHERPRTIRLVVHPGAGKIQNIWPPERFAEVVNHLANRVEVNVFVIEGPRDASPVESFCRLTTPPTAVVRGRSIGDIAALMQSVDLVICNDTGVMHVSCAVGARTLAIFGPTDPTRWAPRCSRLDVVRAPGGDLTALTPELVLEKAVSMLGLGAATQ